MGLFSGSFGTGLASGLATSVDKSMTDAMDKRDKDMTRARSFWETRQAQKQDIAEDETKRAKKSYDRLVKEFGGSTVKALAAYKAIGGSADTVETYLARLDDSRVDDMTYNINDMFKFDNIKLEDYADFTREQAYEDIKTSVSAPDITYKEAPSILTTLGFGRDEKAVSKNIAGQVESLLPSSERVDSGIMAADTPVNIFRGMKDKPIEKTFQAQIVRLNDELAELDVGTDEYTNKLAEYNSVINAATEYTIAMSNPPRDSATVSNLLNGYTTQIEAVESTMGYDTRGGTYMATIAGEAVMGTKALEARNTRVETVTRGYIRENILDKTTANIIGGNGSVQDTMSKQQGEYFLNILAEEQEIMRGELAEGDKKKKIPGSLTKEELEKIDPMFLNEDATRIHARFLDPEASIASIQKGEKGKDMSSQDKIELAAAYKSYAVANLQGEELTKYLESIDRLLPQMTEDEFATSIATKNEEAKAELAAKKRQEMLDGMSPKDREKFLKEEASGQSAEKRLEENNKAANSRKGMKQSNANNKEIKKILDSKDPVSQAIEKRYRAIAKFAGGRPPGNPFIVQELLADVDMPIPSKNS